MEEVECSVGWISEVSERIEDELRSTQPARDGSGHI